MSWTRGEQGQPRDSLASSILVYDTFVLSIKFGDDSLLSIRKSWAIITYK